MAAFQVLLLVASVLGIFLRPARMPNWTAPAVGAVLSIAIGNTPLVEAAQALRPLVEPLAFLLLAVPLSVFLDRLGFFSSVATLVDRGRHPLLGLWILAACVTTFLNLDASVVLLTPLYIRIARRRQLNVKTVALQPVLLACLASSALPISNLTNLIAAQQLDLNVVDFAVHLGPASLVAVVVGWLGYRRMNHQALKTERVGDALDPRALRLGSLVVAFVVFGFTFGQHMGVPPWSVALVADILLLFMVSNPPRNIVPFGAAILAGSLAIVAAAAAPHLGLDRLFDGQGKSGQLQTAALAMIGANTINNLPTLLVTLPAATGIDEQKQLWPLLFGVNFGPIFILHGSLAGLLWRSTASRLDVHISAWEYTKVGLRIGMPAIAASLATVIATSELLGCWG